MPILIYIDISIMKIHWMSILNGLSIIIIKYFIIIRFLPEILDIEFIHICMQHIYILTYRRHILIYGIICVIEEVALLYGSEYDVRRVYNIHYIL